MAHSHGGNVALYALLNENGVEDPRLSDVKITTMSTPFITAERKTLGGGGAAFAHVSTGFLALWLITVVLTVILTLDYIQQDPTAAGGAWVAIAIYGVTIVTALAVLLPVWLSPLVYREPGDGRIRYYARAYGRTASRSAILIGGPAISPARLTILRAPGDEASGLLGLTHLLTWISRRLIGFGWVAVIIAIIASIVATIIAASLGATDASVFAISILVTLFLLAVATTSVLYGSSLFVGWDMTFLAPYVLLTAEASPRGSYEVHVLPTPPGLMAHGLYTSPELIAFLAERTGTASPTRTTS